MKKKIFYQTNLLWQLFCFLFLLVFLIGLVVGIQLITGIANHGLGEGIANITLSIILIVLYFIGISLTLKTFFKLEHRNIYLDSYKIYMKSDLEKKRDKIQYYAEVYYENIKSIDIIWTNKNSQGGVIGTRLISAFVEKPYLSVQKKNGEIVNFFIMYVSKRSLSKLIDEIRMRMESSGNFATILGENELIAKLNKPINIIF